MAVVAFGAPISAAAADSRPDPAPPVVELAPDPAPAAIVVPPRAETAPVARPGPLVERDVTVQSRAPAARTTRSRVQSRRRRAHEFALVDVAPLAVDTPVGLGGVPHSISGDAAVLAALALLAAAGAATSGAGLAIAWSRTQGPGR